MNCSFLHHMKYEPMEFYVKTGLRPVKGWLGQCGNEDCTFTRKVLGPLDSRWTASETSSGASPNPTEKAGVSPSTGTLAPHRGA